MLGTGAAVGALATVAPSEVWPFRKIFLPGWDAVRRWVGIDFGRNESTSAFTFYDEMGRIMYDMPGGMRLANIDNVPSLGEYLGLSRTPYPGPLNLAAAEAIELETFAKQIPDLIFKDRTLYKRLKSANRVDMLDLSKWGRVQEGHEWYFNHDQAKAVDALTKELPEMVASAYPPLYGESRPPFRVPMRLNRALGFDKLDDQLADITRQANDLLTEG